MVSFLKIILPLLFWIIFATVILIVPYPENLVQTNFVQLISFFIPLYLAINFTLNILLRNILVSSSVSLGIISLLILKALDILNLVTGILTLTTTFLLVSYFRKAKDRGLTKLPKISKLTHMRKQMRHPEEP